MVVPKTRVFTGFPAISNHRDDLLDARRIIPREMPPAAVRLRMLQEIEHSRSYIRHIDKLVRAIDGRNQVRRSARCRRGEDAIEKTVLHAWTIEVRQAQHGPTDLSRCIGLEQQVFL